MFMVKAMCEHLLNQQACWAAFLMAFHGGQGALLVLEGRVPGSASCMAGGSDS